MDGATIEDNIYFNSAKESIGDDDFLTALREHDHDLNSAYTDPMFVDWKNEDFRLKPGSPALKLGIIPLDLGNVGLTGRMKQLAKKLRD